MFEGLTTANWIGAAGGAALMGLAFTRGTTYSKFISTDVKFNLITFLFGLITVPNVVLTVFGTHIDIGDLRFVFFDPAGVGIANNWFVWLVAGALIGAGVYIFGECPHGILLHGPTQNLKNGSIAAGVVYGAAALMAWFRVDGDIFEAGRTFDQGYYDAWPWVSIIIWVVLGVLVVLIKMKTGILDIDNIVTGLLTGAGFMLSGLCRTSVTYSGVLFMKDSFRILFLAIVGFTILASFLFGKFLGKNTESSTAGAVSNLNVRFFLGTGLLGAGFGLVGLSITTAAINFFHLPHVILWLGGYVAGSYAVVFGESLIFKESRKPGILEKLL